MIRHRFVFAFVATLMAAPALAQEPVRVYVTPLETSAFVDAASKLRTQVHASLVSELKRKAKTLALVESRDTAQVIVDLDRIDYGDSGKTDTRVNVLTPGVTSTVKGEYAIVAKLSVVGTSYTTELTERNTFSAIAACL